MERLGSSKILAAAHFSMSSQGGTEGGHSRPRYVQPRGPLWLALNNLLGLLRLGAMAGLLYTMPGFLEAALQLGCEGMAAAWPALGCLRSMFAVAGLRACPAVIEAHVCSMAEEVNKHFFSEVFFACYLARPCLLWPITII